MGHTRWAGALVTIVLLGIPERATAGEVQIATGPGVYTSSWRGDTGVGQALRLGYRFGDLVAVDLLGRLGYAPVDDRVLTYVSLGGTFYGRIRKTRPYARLAFVHQHEESTSSVRADPFGALFGVGDGIRHRGGFGSSLGFEVPIRESKRAVLTLGVEASGVWFPDPRGPAIYAGGALWLGVNFGL